MAGRSKDPRGWGVGWSEAYHALGKWRSGVDPSGCSIHTLRIWFRAGLLVILAAPVHKGVQRKKRIPFAAEN
jgi:hypothetical protein